MKLSKKLKKKLKKNLLGTFVLVTITVCTLASMKLTDFSASFEKYKILNDTREVLAPVEKEEITQDFSSSSNLNNIYIGESVINGFTPKKLNYEIILNNKVSQIEISVDKQNEDQEVLGIGTISLTGEEQLIEIKVTSSDKKNTSTYTVLVKYKESGNIKEEGIYNFSYTGDYQEFVAPYTGYYQMELWGAQGGSYSATGGKGAYTSGNIYLKAGQKVYVYVGQTGGNDLVATYNGGGEAATNYYARAGGGATDIRLSSGKWNDFDSLKSRIMVAAGGGGSNGPGYTCDGGAGGALTGYSGSKGGSGSYTVAGGGTQTSAGSPGTGAYSAKPGGFGYGGSTYAGHGGGGRRWLLWRWSEAVIIVV